MAPSATSGRSSGWSSRRDPYDFRRDFSSGVAAGDYDRYGREDLLVMLTSAPPYASNGQPVLLRNVSGGNNRWLKVRALGTVSNRDGVGARVRVTAGGFTRMQEVYAGSSLASMHSQILTFGLGAERRATVDIEWPSGHRNRLYDVRAGSETVFPEIPCSFDDPDLGLVQYTLCVTRSLDRLRRDGLVEPGQAGRMLASALRAYHESR